MALVLANRVQETTTTTGTGTITLAGAVSGFQTFAAIGNGNTTYYTVTSGTAWEVGIGTYTAAGTLLARTTILSSSIGGGAITLAGTSNVFVAYPVEKSVNLDASGNATALGVPASGTVTNLTGTASININGTVGATTATTGAFTTLSAIGEVLTGGTVTASSPLQSSTQTWNNGAVAFTGIKLNITDTASLATSVFCDFQVGGTSRMRVDKIGNVTFPNSSLTLPSAAGVGNWGGSLAIFGSAGTLAAAVSSQAFNFSSAYSLGWNSDTTIFRDAAAGTLAQRNGVNAQTSRIYNTYTDASNYERGVVAWASNVLRIGTEKAGTGTARNVELQYDGTTQITLKSGNETTVGAGAQPLVTFGHSSANTSARIGFNNGVQIMNSTINSVAAIRITNGGLTDTGGIQFGGTTSSFPAIKRSTTTLQARLADDTAFTNIQGKLTTDTAYTAGAPTPTGYITLYDSTGTAYRVPCVV